METTAVVLLRGERRARERRGRSVHRRRSLRVQDRTGHRRRPHETHRSKPARAVRLARPPRRTRVRRPPGPVADGGGQGATKAGPAAHARGETHGSRNEPTCRSRRDRRSTAEPTQPTALEQRPPRVVCRTSGRRIRGWIAPRGMRLGAVTRRTSGSPRLRRELGTRRRSNRRSNRTIGAVPGGVVRGRWGRRSSARRFTRGGNAPGSAPRWSRAAATGRAAFGRAFGRGDSTPEWASGGFAGVGISRRVLPYQQRWGSGNDGGGGYHGAEIRCANCGYDVARAARYCALCGVRVTTPGSVVRRPRADPQDTGTSVGRGRERARAAALAAAAARAESESGSDSGLDSGAKTAGAGADGVPS